MSEESEEMREVTQQFELIGNEMEAFYNETVRKISGMRGSNQKAFILDQLKRLKDKIQEIETRALSVYSEQQAKIEELEVAAKGDAATQQAIERRKWSSETGLKSIQMCCSAYIEGFMHEFDLLRQ